jgi:plastocyanin
MATVTAASAFAVLGRGPAIDAAGAYTDDSSVSTTQVVPAEHLASPLPWTNFAVRTCAWLLLALGTPSTWAATYSVEVREFKCGSDYGCFYPSQLTVNVGDSVVFYSSDVSYLSGPHNVVADDGSFRCARGCDGQGGDGTPVAYYECTEGRCVPAYGVSFTRTFNVPGVIKYHDAFSGATGVIVVVQPIAIGAGITGSWFDPVQSGHGFMIEVLPGAPMRMLVQWVTFAPEGGQSWVYAVGPIDGDRAVLEGIQVVGSGARFPPNFDAAHLNVQGWGTLTFTFSDCAHGHVDWTAAAADYGSGSMDLTRLTLPAGLTCP